MRGLFVTGAAVLLLFAMLSCDAPSSITENTENEIFLQENSTNNKTNISANSLRWIKPGSRTVRNNEVIYTCYIWQKSDNPKVLVWQVLFPGKVTRSAGSETTRFIYKDKNVHGELIRYAGCTIPHTDLAIDLIRNSLHNNRSNKPESKIETGDGSNLVLMSDCGDYECDLEWDPSLQAYVCTAPPCGGGEDEENGDGPPPYGGGGNDPPGDGNGGDYDEELPEHLEPCQTNNSLLNNVSFQDNMYQAWFDSYGPDEDPFDHDQRNEGMYYVKESNGTYYFEPVALQNTSNPISSCHYLGTFSTSKIQNSVALFHTHPYSPNEFVTDQRCHDYLEDIDYWDVSEHGYPWYEQGVSGPDHNIVNTIGLPMYVIDTDNIFLLNPDVPVENANSFERCGY